MKSSPPSSKPVFTFKKIGNICLVLSGGVVAQIYFNSKVVCKEKHSRLAGYRDGGDKHLKFNWKKFWVYMRPEIWYFIAAVIVCITMLSKSFKYYIIILLVLGSSCGGSSKYRNSTNYGWCH